LPRGKFLVLNSVTGLADPRAHSTAGMIRSIEKSSDFVRNQNRDLSACSIVPQTIRSTYEKEFVPRLPGRAMAQGDSRRLRMAAALIRTQVMSCEICGGQMTLGQVFSEFIVFPCQFLFHLLLHIHHYQVGLVQ
jgi:hypothetical protein